MPHAKSTRPPGDFGTADQAMTWALECAPYTNRAALTFLEDWRCGDLAGWPDFLEWLDAQPAEPAPKPRSPLRAAMTALGASLAALYLLVSCALDASIGGPP
jgi:hypothetical protein